MEKILSFCINKMEETLFDSLVDQATPGFELGKKDLQSPALPLGHAAKMIQKNRSEYPPLKKTNVYLFSQKKKSKNFGTNSNC